MNNYKIMFQQSFVNDLESIKEYQERHGKSDESINKNIKRIISNIEFQLNPFPSMFQTIQQRYHIKISKKFHIMPYKVFVIAFSVNESKRICLVEHIFHEKQDVRENLKRLFHL